LIVGTHHVITAGINLVRSKCSPKHYDKKRFKLMVEKYRRDAGLNEALQG